MRVNFKRRFFGPNGVRYRPEDNPHRVPDDWTVPKDAEVLDKKEAAAIEKAEKEAEAEAKKASA